MAQENQGIKKICVYGINGIGGYFGGKMAEALNQREMEGYEVYFVTQGENLRRIQEKGLVVKYAAQEPIYCRPTRVVADFRELPSIDMVLISGRNSELERASLKGAVCDKDDYSGTILRLGRKYRIPTPITDLIDQYLGNIANPPCPEYF